MSRKPAADRVQQRGEVRARDRRNGPLDELCLAAFPVGGNDEPAGNAVGSFRPKILPHDMDAEIEPRSTARRRQDRCRSPPRLAGCHFRARRGSRHCPTVAQKQKQEARDELAKGTSVSAIARKFATARQTITRVRDESSRSIRS